MKYPPVQYHNYLGLDQILQAQKLRSDEFKNHVHDEMLFIITHQTYELWFKQMIFELDSVLRIFGQAKVLDTEIPLAVARLDRMVSIQRFINGQVDLLETMTPMDFLEFREYLYPASGFQSFQWRLIEIKLGLTAEKRLCYNLNPFTAYLTDEQKNSVADVLKHPSLLEQIEKWLERTPFLEDENFQFWQSYQASVEKLFADEAEVIQSNPLLKPEDKVKNQAQIQANLETFHALFDENKFNELKVAGYFAISYKATHAALLILLYRDIPALQMPYRLLSLLLDLDENMTQWRYRHSLMAHRMLGQKIGTGGSSGHSYLKAATEKHKIFTDFFNLSTFLIPKSKLPNLPDPLKKKMSFQEV